MNLVVEKYLEEFPVIEIINQLMVKLSAPLKLAKLRKETDLRPIIRNTRRVSSCFEMINRFFLIKDKFDISDPDLAELMPNHVQLLQLQDLKQELCFLNELTVYLQKSSLNLDDVRMFRKGLFKAS